MPNEDFDAFRRTFVSGLTSGLASASKAPAAGVGLGSALPNPAADYPIPPFPRQLQDSPGLASAMNPKPDHGETSYRGSGRLIGRKALVTGGDSGIGRAAVIAFAREGADVAFNYLPAEESDAQEVVQLIREVGRQAFTLPGDIRDEAFCKQLVDDAAHNLDGLDILVNNAAHQHAVDSIEKISTEQFDKTFKVNVYAMFWITRAAMPYLRPGATIINTSSINAYDPEPEIIDYAATKGAIMIWTKGLAKQLAKRGIRVNAVAPGPVWTPLQPSGGQLPEKLPHFGADTPLGRPGQPAELAPIFVMLAASEATFSTGQVYGATGGRSGP